MTRQQWSFLLFASLLLSAGWGKEFTWELARWGSIGISRQPLLCGRDIRYKNLGDLVTSYRNVYKLKDHQLIDIYIGNDSFGHHISCQMGKPSFVILLDTPRAYSDYSINQKRIIAPGIELDKINHDSRVDPNSISVDLVLDKIKEFI